MLDPNAGRGETQAVEPSTSKRTHLHYLKYCSGLTYKQIAEKVGCHPFYLTSVITGKRRSVTLERKLLDLLTPFVTRGES